MRQTKFLKCLSPLLVLVLNRFGRVQLPAALFQSFYAPGGPSVLIISIDRFLIVSTLYSQFHPILGLKLRLEVHIPNLSVICK